MTLPKPINSLPVAAPSGVFRARVVDNLCFLINCSYIAPIELSFFELSPEIEVLVHNGFLYLPPFPKSLITVE